MNFATQDDGVRAIIATLKYLQPLVATFEGALDNAGFEILSRRHHDGERIPTPVLELHRGGVTLEMHLGNAIEDFLLVDRDEDPVRTDPRLRDDEYARGKLADIVEARVELLEIALLPDGDEKERRLRDVSASFDWVRIARIRGEDES